MTSEIPTKKINVCSISINKDGYITSLIGNSSYFDSEYNIATKGGAIYADYPNA